MGPIVLYFHHIGLERLDHRTSMCRDDFEAMVEALGAQVRLATWRESLGESGLGAGSGPAVLFSFDDGYADTVALVPDILERVAADAMFFVVTGLVGRTASVGTVPGRHRCADWAELRRVVSRGHHVGAHAHRHRPLDVLTIEEQQEEVKRSVSMVGSMLGREPEAFSFPFGRVPKRTADLGLPAAAFGTVREGRAPCWGCDPHRIPRWYMPALEPSDGWDDYVERLTDDWTELLVSHVCLEREQPGVPSGSGSS